MSVKSKKSRNLIREYKNSGGLLGHLSKELNNGDKIAQKEATEIVVKVAYTNADYKKSDDVAHALIKLAKETDLETFASGPPVSRLVVISVMGLVREQVLQNEAESYVQSMRGKKSKPRYSKEKKVFFEHLDRWSRGEIYYKNKKAFLCAMQDLTGVASHNTFYAWICECPLNSANNHISQNLIELYDEAYKAASQHLESTT